MPSNTQVILSASSKQGPETSTAVPPSMLPKRGVNLMTDDGIQSVAVEQLEVLSGITVYGKTVTVPNPGKVLLTYLMMGRET